MSSALPKGFPSPRLTVTELREPFYATLDEIDAWLAYQRSFLYVREVTPNVSPEIHIFQQFCGGSDGDSWCDDFQSYTQFRIWQRYPLKQSGACQITRVRAALLGWLLPRGSKPIKGDQGLLIDVPNDHAHHTFSVSSDLRDDGTFSTLEGNTNPAGGSNGYGVFERTTRRVGGSSTYEFIRIPRAISVPKPPPPVIAHIEQPPAPAPTDWSNARTPTGVPSDHQRRAA